jgi:hypothetical protein
MIGGIPGVTLPALSLALSTFPPLPTPYVPPFSNAHDAPEFAGWLLISILGPSSAVFVVAAVLFYKYVYKPMHDSGRW